MSSLPLIAVDIGNSATKIAIFTQTSAGLPEPEWVRLLEPTEAIPSDLVAMLPDAATWSAASVQRESEQRLARWVNEQRPRDRYRLLSYRDFSLPVRVDQPERVGVDRLAAATAANVLREPGRPAAVVCAGSAVTINLVAEDGGFEGGAILPGFRMGARALASADLLPDVLYQSPTRPPPVLGKNTEAAIRGGLFWGAVGAVREIVERYAEEHRRLQVFVTGGDLQRLAPLVSAEAQFVPNLVLAGIAVASL
jgi:type III pantothenate kinase